MKLTKLLFAFLAMCLILTLTGCDDGGGSGNKDTDAFNSEYEAITGGSTKYVVNEIVDRTDPPISDFSTTSDGIKFKEGGIQFEIKITIFLNADGKFASKEGGKIADESMGNFEYTGTWSKNGTTITMTATKEKNLDTGKVKDCNIEVKTEMSADESTMTDIEIHGESGGKFIYKKQ